MFIYSQNDPGQHRQMGYALLLVDEFGVTHYWSYCKQWLEFDERRQPSIRLYRDLEKLQSFAAKKKEPLGRIQIVVWADDNCDHATYKAFRKLAKGKRIITDVSVARKNYEINRRGAIYYKGD